MTFHSDRAAVESRLAYIPFGPSGAILETTGHGAWQRLPGNQLAVSFLNLLQGAPGNAILNGAFWANEKVNIRPVMGPDSNTFTATWAAAVRDPNGNLLLPVGTGTMSAVRIQVEQ